jgi:CRISPR-associated exonuclease Cas4
MEDYVRVSDISNYLKCPRIVYYANQGHQPEMTTTPAYIAALLIKEMAHSFAEIITSENLDNDLEMLLEDSALNLAAIYRDDIQNLNDEVLNESVELVRSWIGEIKAGIIDSIERFKVDRLVCMLTSHSTEPILYSKKYRLSGTPDRVLMLDKAISLSIIRTGKAPETGIWKNDRIRLTALSILVEEEYDCLVDRSIVEYARYGIVREVQIKRADRRKVLALASRIRKIRTGKLPQRPEDPPCDYCGYKSFCNVTPTLASRFF